MARLLNSIQKEWGLRLNGTTQKVTFAAQASLGNIKLQAFTRSIWVKQKMPIAGGYNQFEKWRGNGVSFGTDTAGRATAFVTDNTSTSTSAFGKANIADDTWRNILYTWDGTTVNLYVDGIIDGTAIGARTIDYPDTDSYVLGTNGGSGSGWFAGLMKDFRIYGSVLTATQVRTIYEQGVNVPFGSPVMWLKMNEGTSTNLADSGSAGYNGTIVGRTTTGSTPSTMWVINPVRPPRLLSTSNTKSVLFNGTSDKIVVADNAALNVGTGDFTYEFKVNLKKMPADTTIPQLLFGKRESAGSYIGWENYFNEGSLVNGPNHFASNHRAIAGNSTFAISNVDVSAGKWYHVVVSVTRATQELYRIFVNGVLDPTYWNTSQYSAGAGTFSNAASLTTGGRNGTVIAGPGMTMYDERLYTRALTDDECLSRYYTNENITSGRVGWWNMDEGAGTSIADSQGTNNGTLTGGTWTLNAQS